MFKLIVRMLKLFAAFSTFKRFT